MSSPGSRSTRFPSALRAPARPGSRQRARVPAPQVQAGQARWAEVAGPDPATRYLSPGAPWQTTFTSGQEGPYTATVRAKDRAGNVATGEEKGFTLDSTPPGLALTLAGAPPFGYILTDSVYYGEGSGVFTLTGVTTDTLASLFSLGFPEATAAGETLRLRSPVPAPQVQAGQARWAARLPQPALTPMPSTPTTPSAPPWPSPPPTAPATRRRSPSP
jgi:hypothetical protein